MSAFQSGSITCASAFGGIFMKDGGLAHARRFGFRSVLVVNAALSGLSIAAYGLFFPEHPDWIIWWSCCSAAFSPSLQFTRLNSLTYADIASRDVGRATSLGSVVQQMSLGLGVTMGGIVLQISHVLHGHSSITLSDFWPAFLVVGLFSFASIPVTRACRVAPGRTFRAAGAVECREHPAYRRGYTVPVRGNAGAAVP